MLAARQARFALQDRGTDLARRLSVGEKTGGTARLDGMALRADGLSLKALKIKTPCVVVALAGWWLVEAPQQGIGGKESAVVGAASGREKTSKVHTVSPRAEFAMRLGEREVTRAVLVVQALVMLTQSFPTDVLTVLQCSVLSP